MSNDKHEYDDDDLKPCPFCGGKAVLMVKNDELFFAKCCICKSKSRVESSLEDCVFIWNNRPLEDKLQAEVERLQSQLDDVSGSAK